MNLCKRCKKAKSGWCAATDDGYVLKCEEFDPDVATTDVVTDGLKHDGGKPRLSLVPPILIKAVGTVMTHGAEKYGVNSYKKVAPERYRDALARHYCEYMEDPYGVDKDSGLPHLYHLACNVAFLLELDKERE